jgi:hypothetical protein
MSRRMLDDRHLLRIADLLPGKPTVKGGRAVDIASLAGKREESGCELLKYSAEKRTWKSC